MEQDEINSASGDDPQKNKSSKRTKKALLIFLATVVFLLIVIWDLSPEGALDAWKCRYSGPCETMSADDYEFWKCQHIGNAHLRGDCGGNQLLKAYRNGH